MSIEDIANFILICILYIVGFLMGRVTAKENGRNVGLLDLAYKKNVELLNEIENKCKEIARLQANPDIAKEAIERYCPQELYSSAMEWLEDQ